MHLETLLYMLLQSDKIVPPLGVKPDFVALADQAASHRVPNQWVKIPARTISVGLNDPENESFVWDNERPARRVHVKAFESKSRGLTNADYALYLQETGKSNIPASWIATTPARDSVILNGKAVRTVYGPVTLASALDWPVMASYDELAGCAKWMGGRVPTADETRSIYSYVDQLNGKDSSGVSAHTIPAVNG